MSCDNPATRGQMKPLRLVGAEENVVGLRHTLTNVAIFPIRWRHFVPGCESWSVDAATWRLLIQKGVDVTHWHLRTGSRRRGTFRDVIYRIAAETFTEMAHSSDDCSHVGAAGMRERLHCPRRFFLYDAEREPPFEEGEVVRQGTLV